MDLRVRVGGNSVLGHVGLGYELTKDWFVEERIMIGARSPRSVAALADGHPVSDGQLV